MKFFLDSAMTDEIKYAILSFDIIEANGDLLFNTSRQLYYLDMDANTILQIPFEIEGVDLFNIGAIDFSG